MTRKHRIIALMVVLGLGLGWMLGGMLLSGEDAPVLATELESPDVEPGDSDEAVVHEASEQTGSPDSQGGQVQPQPEQPQPEEPKDSDSDEDGVEDDADNCPTTSNADQLNFDGDSKGDACDADDDNDGLADNAEAGHGTNPFKKDTDGDGWWDGTEVKQGYDPLDPDSHPILIIKP
jgi:hypothetical protein